MTKRKWFSLAASFALAACSTGTPVAHHASALPGALDSACPESTVGSTVDVRALAGCTLIRGDLRIEDSQLESLDGLERLRRVTGTLRIARNATLTNVEGLARLASVGTLTVTENPKLESLGGFHSLRQARRVTVESNPELTDLTGLEGLRSLESLVVTRSGISSVRGLDGLQATGDLLLLGNPRLISLGGLKELRRARTVRVVDNRRLSTWPGFLPALGGVRGPVIIDGNVSLSETEVGQVTQRLKTQPEISVATR